MPRAVQRATAADVPYSMSSGCATTQSTRWKDSSGRAGNVMSAILPGLVQRGATVRRPAATGTGRESAGHPAGRRRGACLRLGLVSGGYPGLEELHAFGRPGWFAAAAWRHSPGADRVQDVLGVVRIAHVVEVIQQDAEVLDVRD